MVTESNIDIEANIELATVQVKIGEKTIPVAELTKEDRLLLDGYVLYQLWPNLFDNRNAGYDGEKFEGTSKQWQEYIDKLPCALCNKLVSKCKCGLNNDFHFIVLTCYSYSGHPEKLVIRTSSKVVPNDPKMKALFKTIQDRFG